VVVVVALSVLLEQMVLLVAVVVQGIAAHLYTQVELEHRVRATLAVLVVGHFPQGLVEVEVAQALLALMQLQILAVLAAMVLRHQSQVQA
jgi:hypothetical protein